MSYNNQNNTNLNYELSGSAPDFTIQCMHEESTENCTNHSVSDREQNEKQQLHVPVPVSTWCTFCQPVTREDTYIFSGSGGKTNSVWIRHTVRNSGNSSSCRCCVGTRGTEREKRHSHLCLCICLFICSRCTNNKFPYH